MHDKLKTIRDVAVNHAYELAIDRDLSDDDVEMLGEWIDIAKDADHILRKHQMMADMGRDGRAAAKP